ncbi:RidA family protein [Euzebya tangerina]|uniref:RidA family protein n=1 Tax=Euzebya tangerina TaxID=591198 RepID=UPI00196B6407|nr:RidA family protein [Euzebya tangerina]
MSIAQRLAAAGVTLPEAPPPAASYAPWARSGNLIMTAGQIPVVDGSPMMTGILGAAVSLEEGQQAARQCAINVLAQLQAATGDLEQLTRLVKITVFVASAADFHSQHLVANGASDFLGEILGEDVGTHARSAVGVAVLPLNVPVEVEAIAEV